MRKRQSTTPPSTIASRLNRRWDRFWLDHALRIPPRVSLRSTRAATTNKRKQNAARRMSSDGPHRRQVYAVCANHLLRMRLALIAARSPDGVPPRHLLQRANAATQLQNALPGSWLRSGRYPLPPGPVQRQSRRPVIVPAGRLPVSRPGAEVTSPCPREPLLPHRPASPGRRPYLGKIRNGDYAGVDKNPQTWQYAPTLRLRGRTSWQSARNQSRR
jgi:hypothetical protein